MEPIRAGIAGFNGYAGEELARILSRHPGVAPYRVVLPRGQKTAPKPGSPAGAYSEKSLRSARAALGQSRSYADQLTALSLDEARDGRLDVALLAIPAEISMELAGQLLANGTRVVDLSGAFRLSDPELFLAYYGNAHPYPELLQAAIYGLSEKNAAQLADARLVANPGCHAAAANLALFPLCEAGLIDLDAGIVCDSKTGASGAGKKARAATHFCALAENMMLYGSFGHRHVGEILQLNRIEAAQFSFSTQLLPIRRGIFATLYFRLSSDGTAESIAETYGRAYDGKPFLEVLPAGTFPNLESVCGTNLCRLGFAVADGGRRVIVVSALDNLIKGAAGQAVQNMNLMFGFNETEGLVS